MVGGVKPKETAKPIRFAFKIDKGKKDQKRFDSQLSRHLNTPSLNTTLLLSLSLYTDPA